MLTKEDQRLIASAKQMKAERPDYRPSKEELLAIDMCPARTIIDTHISTHNDAHRLEYR